MHHDMPLGLPAVICSFLLTLCLWSLLSMHLQLEALVSLVAANSISHLHMS
jgi:hypothetical protein